MRSRLAVSWFLLLVGVGVAAAHLVAGRPAGAVPAAEPSEQAASVMLAAWVEQGPDSAVLARAITTAPTCPTHGRIPLRASDPIETRPMEPRAQADRAFPHLVCEATVEYTPNFDRLAIGSQVFPLPKRNPERIVVIGDTGCRLKGHEVQACNDPAAWPFARVAASAAAWQPDLVIHVGDYLYRESPCPPKDDGCAGSPYGDNWAGWQADFFAPAAPLLRAAPWVFARGNHELCARGGDGWFRFLDPRPRPAACTDYTEPYAAGIEGLQLLVLDSADANDFTAHPDQVAHYAAQLATLRGLARDNAWLITHRPPWAVGPEDASGARLFRTNPTLQAAAEAAGGLPSGVQLVQSGHVHLFELLTFGAARPPQFVVGTGGTHLDPALTVPVVGGDLAGAPIVGSTTTSSFGYLALERAGASWTATLHDPSGAPVVRCAGEGRQASCGP